MNLQQACYFLTPRLWGKVAVPAGSPLGGRVAGWQGQWVGWGCEEVIVKVAGVCRHITPPHTPGNPEIAVKGAEGSGRMVGVGGGGG